MESNIDSRHWERWEAFHSKNDFCQRQHGVRGAPHLRGGRNHKQYHRNKLCCSRLRHMPPGDNQRPHLSNWMRKRKWLSIPSTGRSNACRTVWSASRHWELPKDVLEIGSLFFLFFFNWWFWKDHSPHEIGCLVPDVEKYKLIHPSRKLTAPFFQLLLFP